MEICRDIIDYSDIYDGRLRREIAVI